MIFPAAGPLEPHGTPLRALHVSLNSPIVTLEGLATGPASAAVALHDAGATLCVRSVRTGHARLFTTTEEVASHRQTALDAALSLAESMGFLFDDDEVARRGDPGPEEAAALWRELCGEGREPEVDQAPAAAPAEILLDEPWEAAPEPEARPAPPLASMLSKFRWAASAPDAGTDPLRPPH